MIVARSVGKIDPYDLGAFDLDSSLSKDYCRRICSPVDKQKRTQRSADYKALVETYPAHEFGIDREEARVLGLNVCEPSEVLDDVFEELRQHLDKVNSFIGLIDRDKEIRMKKSRQSPHKPRRKIRNSDLHKQNEIHELFQESEERVRQFLEEFNAERSLSYDQSHQRKR